MSIIASRLLGSLTIREVQWRHPRHCHNTPPCWRYRFCEQIL